LNVFEDARFLFLPKPNQILPNFTKFTQILPSLSKFTKILAKFAQALPELAYILPKFT